MNNIFSRTKALIERMFCVFSARVLLVGLGGVGGYAGEMLVRGVVGHFVLVDGDRIDESNLNKNNCT